MEYGSDWENRVGGSDGRLTLGNLANFLNSNLFDDFSWSEQVREVLSWEPYADIVAPDKDGTLADVRNDLDHNNISNLSHEDYRSIKSDIEEIFRETTVEIPVLGKVLGENMYGAYTVHPFTGGAKNDVEIMTDKELDTEALYYFPPDTLGSDPVREIDADEIVECWAHRVLEGIEDYGQVSIGGTTE